MVNHCFELVNNGEICSVTPGVDRPRCEKRRRYTVGSNTCWLVVLTILKNIRQWEGLSNYIQLSHIYIYPYIMENRTCLKPPTSLETSLDFSVIEHLATAFYYLWNFLLCSRDANSTSKSSLWSPTPKTRFVSKYATHG